MFANILILGGDLRQIRVGEEFADDLYNVSFCGFDREYIKTDFVRYENLFDALNENDIIVIDAGLGFPDESMPTLGFL